MADKNLQKKQNCALIKTRLAKINKVQKIVAWININ